LKLSPAPVDEETGPDPNRHQVVIQVGDIKGSPDPRYHQKWQVAVYARILEKMITDQRRADGAQGDGLHHPGKDGQSTGKHGERQ
jgi:hypothetical protein